MKMVSFHKTPVLHALIMYQIVLNYDQMKNLTTFIEMKYVITFTFKTFAGIKGL